MKFDYLSKRVGEYALALFVLFGIVAVGATTTQAQWSRDRRYDDPRYEDRRYDRDDWRRNRGYNNTYEVARQQGYSYGLNTGAADAQRGQSYNPQRSRYFKNGTEGYNSYYGNKGQYKQAFRDAFVQGYREGYQRYAYNRRSNNGRWGIWRPY
ncbi:MAG TPA: hypothetical protein VIG25_01565 [Pyrinomonadaceae bacterium]